MKTSVIWVPRPALSSLENKRWRICSNTRNEPNLWVFPRRERTLTKAPCFILLHLHLIWGMNYGPIQLIPEDRCCSSIFFYDVPQRWISKWALIFSGAPPTGRQFFGPPRDSRTTPAAVIRCTRLFENNTRPVGKNPRRYGHFGFLVQQRRSSLLTFTIVERSRFSKRAKSADAS